MGFDANLMGDFTLQKYKNLCLGLLECGYRPMTLSSFISNRKSGERVCILRHDVDRKLNNALKMAELEGSIGVRSTYYFRYPFTFNPAIIRNIASIGHEIGYHYETLAKASGDHEKAIQLFEKELIEFRKVADIKTICMHGSPLSRFDNRDLWNGEDFKRFGIDGEAYLSVKDVNYFSDTGRNWNGKNNIRDFLHDDSRASFNVNTTDELISLINQRVIGEFYILTHPERWASSKFDWGQSYLKDCIFNLGKKALKGVKR